jgi:hypothetical protein
MIGQALPGPQTSFWPFNKDASPTANNNGIAKQPPMSPRTVEMRSDMYGHEKQFAKKAHTMMDGSSIAEQGLLMTLLFGSSSTNDQTTGDDANYPFPVNTGIPKVQSITLTHLNREYEGYRYSVRAAVTTKVQASREYAQTSFRRVLEKVLARLDGSWTKRPACWTSWVPGARCSSPTTTTRTRPTAAAASGPGATIPISPPHRQRRRRCRPLCCNQRHGPPVVNCYYHHRPTYHSHNNAPTTARWWCHPTPAPPTPLPILIIWS